MSEEDKEKARRKFRSRKWLACLWAMFMAFALLVLTGIAMFREVDVPAWFGVTMTTLIGVVVAYLGVNGWQKTTELKEGGE